jgi:4-hydroxybenzoate polyprenyltransferase
VSSTINLPVSEKCHAQGGTVNDLFIQVRRGLSAANFFIRFSALGGTIILPLLGAATVSRRFTSSQSLGLIGVAIAFHSFAYVLNDVIDLPIDRTEPRRAAFPLVRGVIRPWQALVFALLQAPLALALTAWLGGDGWAYITLGASFVLMGIYNLWGKRSPFPPLTDTIQGLSWGSLALYSAIIMPGRLTNLTGIVMAFTIILTVIANGVHGSLRDLNNDLNCGVRSTAILLGARPRETRGGLVIPRQLTLYALTLQAMLTGVTLAPLASNEFGYEAMAWCATTGAILIMTALSLRLLMVAFQSADDRSDMLAAGMAHLLLTLSSLIVLFALYMDRGLLIIVLATYTVPLLTHSWLYDTLRWGVLRTQGIREKGKRN